MSELNLSKVEIPLHSKSMSNHESPKFDLISIKQIGDYILGEEIGSGAFGKVLLGRHILTEEKVAIKVLDKSILNQTPEDYELVMKEISILKLVKHKYIVQLYEILQTAQHIFIIMEYCEGKEILDYILQKTKLTELESLKYFQQLINCLFYLHSQNIAHRDVKIDNMLLDSNKDLKLIDFGLSTKYTDDDLLDQPCGTVVYAAPEVLEGKEYHGMLADVWSSGIVLYGMLAGYLPFSDKDDEVNKKQVIKGQIKMPEFLSDSVKDLLKHMLDVNPMTRYTLQEIKDHPWFNTVECVLIPGIIIDYNIIPIDDKIINLCVTYNKDKNDVINSIINNKHDSNSALYYLLIKKLLKKGIHSISDMCSDEFIDFVLDDNNLINKENDDNKEEKKEISEENDTEENRENREILNIIRDESKEILIKNEIEKDNINNNSGNKVFIEENLNIFNSPDKNKESSKQIESNDELKKSATPIIKKDYDKDEAYINKDSKSGKNEMIEIKNSEKSLNLGNDKEIEQFKEKDVSNDKNDSSFEQIIIEEEKRLNTYIYDNNKIFGKIMDNLESNANKMKITTNIDIRDISNIESENNVKKNIIKINDEKETSSLINISKEINDSLIKEKNSKLLINNEIDLNNKNKENIKDEIIKNKDENKSNNNIINSMENLNIQKEKNNKLNIRKKENEKGKQFDKHKEKINNKNKCFSNTTKKRLYFNEKSNKVLKQLKKNLTKQKYVGLISPSTEIKVEKNQAIFKFKKQNKINYNANENIKKREYNSSSRNSKNKYVLINNKIKSNQKNLHHKKNFTNLKRKTSNKIFNIINIINNNYNSTESEIKMKHYYQSPCSKNKENMNILNLQKKFDEISVQNMKDLNNNDNIALSPDKNISNSKKDNERNTSKSKSRVNAKTNNITIIIQNKKGIYKNNINGNIIKSIINFDNKNILNYTNLTNSKTHIKNIENNNLEYQNQKNIRTKNLESSVQEKRYKSPIGVRELSESPKQKYLNKKTRLNRIPWKLKKKGIDNKQDSKQIYNQYKMKIQNPFNQNNSKIVNVNKSIKNSFCNSYRSSLCETKKTNKSSFANTIKENKFYQNRPKNIKQIKHNNRIQKEDNINKRKGKNSQEKIIKSIYMNNKDNHIFNSNFKPKNINSLFSMSSILTNINNTENKTSFLNIQKSIEKIKFKQNHNLPINSGLSINLKKKFNKTEIEFNNAYTPMNLCCLFLKKNDMASYKNQLINKFKKNIISFTPKKNNCFLCSKNGYICEIQICKININNKSLLCEIKGTESSLTECRTKHLYYLQIYRKKESFGINNIFKKFVLNLD